MHIIVPIICLLLLTAAAGAESSSNPLLTNAVDILSLPGERAWGLNVRIRGIVTAAQPSTALQPNWDGGMFVQDGTAGVYALAANRRSPEPGDLVEVTGISHPGGFAPFINDAHWIKLGTAPLPEAKSAPVEQLMAGIEDGQRVEIAGVVRSFVEDKPVVMFEITSGGYRLKVFAPPLPDIDLRTLIGAKVRVRGTTSTFYSGLLRQLISVELHVPFASDFIIEKKHPADSFLSPTLPLGSLGQYRHDRELGERVHVKGTVTYQRRGQDLFLQDATKAIQVESRGLEPVAPGEMVEAVGFLEFENFLPVLKDSSFRKTPDPPAAVEPKSTPISELQAGYRHAELIRLQGKVLDYAERQAGDDPGGNAKPRSILTLQQAGTVFTVEGFSSEPNQALAGIPIGSTIEVDGICFMNIADDGKLQTLQVLLPSANDVRILEKPDWLTPRRLLAGVTILAVVLLVAVTWIVMVQKRNQALKVSIQERIKAQQELQQSNDQLEWRVAERTKQLKVEMTARKEAKVHFEATLAERTRLAQELHDTLEQTLTGIALQMDTAAKFSPNNATRADHHLELARHLVSQSQAEVRNSVWDLRSKSPESVDLGGLLLKISRQLTDDTSIQAQVLAKGQVRPLPDFLEENLLRVAQESLTNIIKHSQATQATITLDYGPQYVILTIADNGGGFQYGHQPGPQEGHFGLLGITERANRLRGKVSIASEPGKGTTVQVVIPIDPPPDSGRAGSHLGSEL